MEAEGGVGGSGAQVQVPRESQAAQHAEGGAGAGQAGELYGGASCAGAGQPAIKIGNGEVQEGRGQKEQNHSAEP